MERAPGRPARGGNIYRRRMVFGSALAVSLLVGLGLYYLTEPQYTARTDVVVAATPMASGGADASVSIDSVVQVLRSDEVLGEVARALNYPGGAAELRADTTITPVINSRILQVYVSSPRQNEAYDAVRTLTERFIETRRQSLFALDQSRTGTPPPATGSRMVDIRAGSMGAGPVSAAAYAGAGFPGSLALPGGAPGPDYMSRAAAVSAEPARESLPVYAGSALALGLILASLIDRLRARSNRER